ncbi:MAG TPA: spore coat protein U domain-containing protein [Burkholderiales bacterium]|nr:spore coat protein U domain-containing protein [Burkholderiales bacterium]
MTLRNHKMKFLAAIAGFAMLASGNVLAGNTNTLRVTAAITGTCNFSANNNTAGNTTLDFGTLDQATGGNVVATTTSLQYWCTKGEVATNISAGNGANTAGCSGTRCLSNGTDLIPYSLAVSFNAAVGSGKSTPINVDFDGGIVDADYIDVSAGNYSDLVTLTITP